jgi:peptidoglycan hydrolase-like protein with peptidoglycan-binding domain
MAASRNPKPLGTNPEVQSLNDGTMVRRLSPRPGPVGKQASSIGVKAEKPAILPTTRSRRGRSSGVGLQVLKQGSRGPEVQKLQRLLNRRLTPSPKIAVDGLFGPSTHQAVIRYQQGVSIDDNGIVDKQTWYRLLRGDTATLTQASDSLPPLSSSEPAGAPARDVWEMPLVDKFSEVLHRTGPKLPGSMRQEFEAMLSPSNLTIMASTLVIWAASHAFGVGAFIDGALLISGAIFLGKAIIDAAEALGNFLVVTSEAENEEDLDEGASYLTIAITILGVVAFFAILTKISRRMSRGGASKMPEETVPPRKPPASRPARQELPPAKPPAPRQARREPPPTKPPARPRVPSKVKVELESKYGPLGQPTRQPGEGIVSKRPIKWGDPTSRPAYGHSQSTHGAKRAAKKNMDRARTIVSEKQGQFYDDNFIVEAEQRAPLTPGVHDVPMGRPVGRVYHKDGTVTENVTTVRVKRRPDLTVETSFPID